MPRRRVLWLAAGALGADGTPIVVSVSADGRVASPVVGGRPTELELLCAAAVGAER